MKDDVFGYVLKCNRADDDLIILDPVDYGVPSIDISGHVELYLLQDMHFEEARLFISGSCTSGQIKCWPSADTGASSSRTPASRFHCQNTAWPLDEEMPTDSLCVIAAAMGPFTINIWVKANASDMDGDLFTYFFSHSAYATRQNYANVDTFHPNQVSA